MQMKRILITGANSYIGVSFEKWLKKESSEYQVDTLDMLNPKWIEFSFSSYDVVLHVAGIAHIKETTKNSCLYYEINRDLAFNVAKKAKAEGVSHFIFMSSMSVYGMDIGIITRDTVPHPKSNYGKSKLEAEALIDTLSSNTFNVLILRPPMIYGKGCRGNFQVLVKLVDKLPVFPKVKNERSMLHIDSFNRFLKLAIKNKFTGIYFPQNRNFVCTSEIARIIAKSKNKKIYLSYFAGLAVKIGSLVVPVCKKSFGSLTYVNTELNDFAYCEDDEYHTFVESI